jgi:phospholipid/cholesterol/gamma-HCH transport system substrate-binding protein
LRAYFQNANNLKSGADVQLEGVTIGNVGDVQVSKLPDPEKAVEATLRLDQKYQNIIRSDSKVTIATIGLLGDSKVDITRGTEAGTVIRREADTRGGNKEISGRCARHKRLRRKPSGLSDKFRDMADRVDRAKARWASSDGQRHLRQRKPDGQRSPALVRDAHTGNGTVGRLISDDQLYEKVSSTMDTMNTLLAKIENGPRHGRQNSLMILPCTSEPMRFSRDCTQSPIASNAERARLENFRKTKAFTMTRAQR